MSSGCDEVFRLPGNEGKRRDAQSRGASIKTGLSAGVETALVSSLSGSQSSDAAPMWTPLDREPWEFDWIMDSGWVELWKQC